LSGAVVWRRFWRWRPAAARTGPCGQPLFSAAKNVHKNIKNGGKCERFPILCVGVVRPCGCCPVAARLLPGCCCPVAARLLPGCCVHSVRTVSGAVSGHTYNRAGRTQPKLQPLTPKLLKGARARVKSAKLAPTPLYASITYPRVETERTYGTLAACPSHVRESPPVRGSGVWGCVRPALFVVCPLPLS